MSILSPQLQKLGTLENEPLAKLGDREQVQKPLQNVGSQRLLKGAAVFQRPVSEQTQHRSCGTGCHTSRDESLHIGRQGPTDPATFCELPETGQIAVLAADVLGESL